MEKAKDIGKILGDSDGILIPGGFGNRGIEGKIKAVQFARENNVPFFGICLGMQVATVEFARNVCGMTTANSTEFDTATKYPVISLIEEQKKIKDMGATMRLGAYGCKISKRSKAFQAYNKKETISERHRHRYEFNGKYRKQMESKGALIAGMNLSKGLVEIFEIKAHPWFVACQFHPEFKSKPDRAHPLFRQFIAASVQNQKK